MHKLEVFGLDAKAPQAATAYSYPERWDECSVAHLATIAALTSVQLPELDVPLPEAEEKSRHEQHDAYLRLWLLRQLSEIPDEVFARLDVSGLLELVVDEIGAERVELLPSLSWCMKAPLFAKSLVPEVTVRGQVYTGPGNLLSGMSVLQWGFCDLLLTKLSTTPDVETMHKLLGALYVEKGQPWNNEHIEVRGAALSALDDRTKLAAVINYRGLRTAMAMKYERCFRGGAVDKHGVRGMIVRMAGPKFGTVEQTRSADLNDVLIHVEQLLMDEERNKQNA